MASSSTEQLIINQAIRIYADLQEGRFGHYAGLESIENLVELKKYCPLLNEDDCQAIYREMATLGRQLLKSNSTLSANEFWKMVVIVVSRQFEYRRVYNAVSKTTERNRERLLKKLK
ncbi:uncharacterized protein LOC132205675 [Neocloeon triangulifer]|uniref:uncharacterized protein LOC132205675 n=1 Tax=Neocloeon triangulifer TaxID=2078957 RepID=UPI00286F303A|nr:uncharacterized protein LOC132205675 [Neocloeon triangulifer]